MALKIRLQRGGRIHNPAYRIIVAESHAKRDGRFVEIIGHYTPRILGKNKKYNIKLDRFNYWKSVGAKPTNAVAAIAKNINKSSL